MRSRHEVPSMDAALIAQHSRPRRVRTPRSGGTCARDVVTFRHFVATRSSRSGPARSPIACPMTTPIGFRCGSHHVLSLRTRISHQSGRADVEFTELKEAVQDRG